MAAETTAATADANTVARAETRAGLTWIDRLTLGAIGLVVVLVTVPVLRTFGLRENELDALRTLRVLAAQPGVPGADARASGLSELVARDPTLARRLEDLEALPDGRLRRHGYLFDVAALAHGEPALRAWPWEHGRTGRAAFLWSPARGTLGCANAAGLYSGPSSPPDVAALQAGGAQAAGGWTSLPRR